MTSATSRRAPALALPIEARRNPGEQDRVADQAVGKTVPNRRDEREGAGGDEQARRAGMQRHLERNRLIRIAAAEHEQCGPGQAEEDEVDGNDVAQDLA